MRLCALATFIFGLLLFPAVLGVSPSSDLQSLLRVEGDWDAANFHHDVMRLTSVLSPNFVEITEDGNIISRAAALSMLSAKPATGLAYAVNDRRCSIRGDIATITASYTEIGRSTHGYYKVKLRIADVYEYHEGWHGIVGYAHVLSISRGLTHRPQL